MLERNKTMRPQSLSTVSILVICIMLFIACAAPAGAPAPGGQAAAPAAEQVTLSLVVPSDLVDELGPIINNAAIKLNAKVELIPDDLVHGGVWLTCYPAPLSEKILTRLTAGDPIDMFMGSSQAVPLIVNQFSEFGGLKSSTRDDDILRQTGLSDTALNAFTDSNNQVVGIAQGTAPVMMIYNPATLDKYGIPHPDNWSWENMLEQAKILDSKMQDDEQGVVIWSDPSVALAAIESAYNSKHPETDTFDVYRLLTIDAMDVVQTSAPIIDEFFSLKKVVSSSYGDFASDEKFQSDFGSGKIAITLNSSAFLTNLINQGYRAEISFLPSYGDPGNQNHRGGSAMMAGWLVPNTSKNPERAWQLAASLSQDPDMIKWGLKHGLLPVTDQGWKLVREDESFLSERDLLPQGLNILQQIATESTAWQVPQILTVSPFNSMLDKILELGVNTTVDMADNDGQLKLIDVLDQLQQIRSDEGEPMPTPTP